jgi:membrane protein implicated in regulation of membrane protease activity
MDDGPRTGGLQALLLIVAGVGAFVAFGAGAWGGAPVAIGALALVVWLEIYARRRVREDREEEDRRRRNRAIAHLDFDDPFGPYDRRP